MQKIILLASLSTIILAQINAGIINLISFKQSNTYAIQNLPNSNFIISLATFTSIQNNNSCEI